MTPISLVFRKGKKKNPDCFTPVEINTDDALQGEKTGSNCKRLSLNLSLSLAIWQCDTFRFHLVCTPSVTSTTSPNAHLFTYNDPMHTDHKCE